MMASLTPDTPGNHIEATIPNTEQFDGVTLYNISITVGPVCWSVKQRYNAFSELHDKLVSNHGVARDLLPPKKIIGNKDPAFVEKRRGDLQLYLQTIINFMHHALPRELAEFLDFHEYELTHLLQSLARRFFHEGDQLLVDSQPVTFTPLQLHAISHRLKNPLPRNVASEQETDFSHVADFASQVKYLVVEGSNEFHRTSNIVQNKLSYSLNTFQNVEKLAIIKARVSNIGHLGAVRRTTKSLVVNESEMKTMSDVLMCGAVYKETVEGSEPHIWALLTDVDVSFNEISKIDDSITLAPNIEKLNLSNNKLSSIDSLTSLPHLVSLNLSSNLFSELDEMHTKLGNVVELNLSQNNLKSLKGLGKLYSLTSLNVSTNNILEIVEVSHISRLPCLETLIITGNPVATVVDYRTKVLELFSQRASEICLDNERPTRRELDTVAVLQAIRASREGRLPTLSFSNPVPISTTTLAFVTPDIATAVSESSNND
ncbi:nischarin-like isoform X1 [Macrobrachium nipponense]|uniref:nischarin-like isoform X1 n=2 Tax=Macrobrachium nipponense TaxID=159736 RepID=UPI0030C81969